MDVNEKWRWQRRIGMFDQTWSVRTEKPGIATNLHDHPTFGDEHPFSAVSLDPSLLGVEEEEWMIYRDSEKRELDGLLVCRP